MIDPIQVAQLDAMFEHWLDKYKLDILSIKAPVILIDASLPGYLELMSEMDFILENRGITATVRSVSSDNTLLNDQNVLLCVTKKGSMISTLAQVRIYGVVDTGMGQVWEISDY